MKMKLTDLIRGKKIEIYFESIKIPKRIENNERNLHSPFQNIHKFSSTCHFVHVILLFW